MIRAVTSSDAAAIAEIYNHYIENTAITFEGDCVDAVEIQNRINKTTTGNFPWICFVDPQSEELIGYAYAGPWRDRHAFRFTAETSIYLRDGHQGQGIGRQLFEELLRLLRAGGFRQAVAGISIPNEASIRSHQAMGFHKAGLFEKAGFKFDRWIDVEFWQLEL